MAGYRRFVAYVYEYIQGKKGDGKGFIKVEVRDGICRMNYRLSGVYGQEKVPCKIYGFVRKEGMCEGVLIGNCDLAGEMVQFEAEMPEEKLGGSSYSLNDLNGLIMLGDNGIMYGTGWDEKPIRLEEIRLPGMRDEKDRKDMERGEEQSREVQQINPETHSRRDENPAEPEESEAQREKENGLWKKKGERKSTYTMEGMQGRTSEKDVREGTEGECTGGITEEESGGACTEGIIEEKPKRACTEGIAEEKSEGVCARGITEEESEEGQQIIVKERPRGAQEVRGTLSEEISREIRRDILERIQEASDIEKEMPEEIPIMQPGEMPEERRGTTAGEISEKESKMMPGETAKERREMVPEDANEREAWNRSDLVSKEGKREMGEYIEETQDESTWNREGEDQEDDVNILEELDQDEDAILHMRRVQQEVNVRNRDRENSMHIQSDQSAARQYSYMPFTDGDIVSCMQITPADYRMLGHRDRGLMNNNFLRHGFNRYHHVLLGKKRDGRYILGVPGMYDRQECLMAGMFGFPNFKEAKTSGRKDAGRFGYWYRLIDAPDINLRNRF